MPLIIYYISIRGSVAIVAKLFLMVLTYVLARKFLFRIFAVKLFEINKDSKEIKNFQDGFKTKLSNIQEMSVVEEVLQSGEGEIMQYRLRFVLPDGEKTSTFALTSYNKVEEMITLIKNAS